MKKFLELYDHFAAYVCKFNGDKYVHLIVGLIIAYLVSAFASIVNVGYSSLTYAFIGFLASVFAMILKEVLDFFRGHLMDSGDILFGVIGGLIGVILYVI